MGIILVFMFEDKVLFFIFYMFFIFNREDFIFNFDSGKFIVKKDEFFVGNVCMVYRDERIFD